jgi:hypothetical protein
MAIMKTHKGPGIRAYEFDDAVMVVVMMRKPPARAAKQTANTATAASERKPIPAHMAGTGVGFGFDPDLDC